MARGVAPQLHVCETFSMSLAEVKFVIERLSSEERLELLVWMEEHDRVPVGEISIAMDKQELSQAIRLPNCFLRVRPQSCNA